MFRLRNPIQRYDWGSLVLLPAMLGVEPDGTTQAELWMGAHPSAPSAVQHHGEWIGLDAVIAAEAEAMVGPAVRARFGDTLPFLFKVLAAAEPLSLQLHPDLAAARAGFAREEAAGLARHDGARRYPDANHKPELLVALEPFDVLSGFRTPRDIAALLVAFGLASPWVELAAGGDAGRLCAALWALPGHEQEVLADRVLQAATTAGSAAITGFADEADFVRRAGARHPRDVGLVVGLCLNRLRLQPGQAAFAGAGRLHSYLHGFGLEIMANSDNVVRGGLTSKAVDVTELLALLVTTPDAPVPISPSPAPAGPGSEHASTEAWFPVSVEEFALSRFDLRGDVRPVASPGPEILCCVDGVVDVVVQGGLRAGPTGGASETLTRGQSVFVPAAQHGYQLRGAGTVYRASVGLHAPLWGS